MDTTATETTIPESAGTLPGDILDDDATALDVDRAAHEGAQPPPLPSVAGLTAADMATRLDQMGNAATAAIAWRFTPPHVLAKCLGHEFPASWVARMVLLPSFNEKAHDCEGSSKMVAASIEPTIGDHPGQSLDASALKLIDCDVHHGWTSVKDVLPYLPRYWVHYIEGSGFRDFPGAPYPKGSGGGVRADARPSDGRPAGSVPELVRRQLLDEFGVSFAILTGTFYNVAMLPNPDLARALASAINDWMIDHWLGFDFRFRGSLTVALQDPEGAVAEIDRLGDRSDIVQILVPAGSREPYGKRAFHPVWEACERHGLAVGVHFGGTGLGSGNPPTAVGWPSYYVEWHTDMSQAFQAQMVSLVCEGVFEKFPRLKFVFIEGGVAWLPHVLWRLDKNWKGLRSEVPWLKRPPSEYIREHFRFTSQPIEEPDNPEHLLQLFEMIAADRLLMFASDYPHWDFDSPTQAFPRLPAELKRRIFVDNARELYRL